MAFRSTMGLQAAGLQVALLSSVANQRTAWTRQEVFRTYFSEAEIQPYTEFILAVCTRAENSRASQAVKANVSIASCLEMEKSHHSHHHDMSTYQQPPAASSNAKWQAFAPSKKYSPPRSLWLHHPTGQHCLSLFWPELWPGVVFAQPCSAHVSHDGAQTQTIGTAVTGESVGFFLS